MQVSLCGFILSYCRVSVSRLAISVFCGDIDGLWSNLICTNFHSLLLGGGFGAGMGHMGTGLGR